ncbi:nitroreductase family deazaflavin-dependent oxidoreductase [Rhodococcus oryzae]|uniref:Nitroreductase family deazaflavin-dependent oxidoreductase n=1 Tax=Rhodococcus oryzae TaxID=2571143 RepID=A0ABY2RGC9_9NOCA|nr:nitroreductase/quinone reductase family protein [Rhodococcus oryzae]TJZ75988.1 nitroreductase family deazaflavin-dependent oxidoreductase [Rhodococcus oryzae]
MHATVKAALAFVNRVTAALYRTSDGRLGGKSVGLPVLLLTVPGRKTGIPRTVPVIYLEHGDLYVVVGSAFGSKTDPDWMRNLAAADSVRIRVADQEWDVSARIATGDERDRLWRNVIAPELPSLAKHEARSGRAFPVGVLARP